MFGKEIVLKASPIALAVALALGSGAVLAGEKGYVGNKTGTVVNSAGECWRSAGVPFVPSEACGDVMAVAMVDTDGDGVQDSDDKCPGTPAGATVDAVGCEIDSDGDGVPDSRDRCPNTPANTKVDVYGCTIIDDITINLVEGEFDFDSAVLKPGMETALDSVASEINASAGDEALNIVGYTDSTGPEDYNMGLSERRAQAVADYLAGKGVSADKMTVSGMGEASPVADNGTREGRADNRRVEIKSN